MPKIELTTEQKNTPITLLTCSKLKCNKKEGQPAIATRLCPFCKKIGYCSLVCLNSDLPKHIETCCHINPVATVVKNKVESKPLNVKQNISNINDYISETEDGSSSDSSVQKPAPKKTPAKKASLKMVRYKK